MLRRAKEIREKINMPTEERSKGQEQKKQGKGTQNKKVFMGEEEKEKGRKKDGSRKESEEKAQRKHKKLEPSGDNGSILFIASQYVPIYPLSSCFDSMLALTAFKVCYRMPFWKVSSFFFLMLGPRFL